jgi:hypothetical protein
MIRTWVRTLTVLGAMLLLAPGAALAQTTVAGTVTDTSGGALPGVTVEAASPVLIEQSRTAVTDGTGQYRIIDLRPGSYTLTVTLPGFNTIQRAGVELSGGVVTTINFELRVGGVQETVVVTGETPTVDVQSTRRQAVLDNQLVNQLPTSRGYGDLTLAVPTLQGGSLNASVNSLAVIPEFFTIHGGRPNEGQIQVDGMTAAASFNGGGVSGYGYDIANAAEIQVTLTGGLGEAETGGPTFNLVSGSGGNTFAGTAFLSSAGEWSQGSNLDAELEAFGITDPPGLIKSWDASATLGGPIVRDRLWFFGNYRDYGNHTDIPGLYANANAGDPTRWDYVADTTRQARGATSKQIASIRLTSQVTPRNKVGFYYDYQQPCDQGAQAQGSDACREPGDDWVLGSAFFGPILSPEAISNYWDQREKITQLTWTSPVTNRLLFDAGFSSFMSHWGWNKQPGAPLDQISVLDPLSAGPIFYRGLGWFGMQENEQTSSQWRASASYVTGAHNAKFGYRGAYYMQEHELLTNDQQLNYFLFGGFPLQFTMQIRPWQFSNRTQSHAFYAQDQWTLGRLSLQGALRYDYAFSYFPAEHNGAGVTRFNAQPITFPRTDGVTGFHDISPRMGAAYDLRGDGKTAIKVNFGRYLQTANNDGVYTASNPTSSFQNSVTRAWFDADGDYVVDCDMLSPVANGECTADDLGNFGNPNVLTQVDPDVLSGWGKRSYDWTLGLAVQQEVWPGGSVEVGYHRRSFGNFFVTDNILIDASDFTLTDVAVPTHARLPDGGGGTAPYYQLNPGVPTAFQNRFTKAENYGDWTQYWHGVDVVLNARLRNGVSLQVGTTTGRGVLDNCEVVAQVPEMFNAGLTSTANSLDTAQDRADSCNVAEKWLTQLRGNAAYTVPGIDVLVSGIFRSQPNAAGPGGNNLGTNGLALSAENTTTINGSLQTVNVLLPGQNYADRINQFDMRLTKILRFGGTRTSIGIDILNIFNSNTAVDFLNDLTNPATFMQPTEILNPRFVRFNITVDY